MKNIIDKLEPTYQKEEIVNGCVIYTITKEDGFRFRTKKLIDRGVTIEVNPTDDSNLAVNMNHKSIIDEIKCLRQELREFRQLFLDEIHRVEYVYKKLKLENIIYDATHKKNIRKYRDRSVHSEDDVEMND